MKIFEMLDNWEDYLDRFILPLIIGNVILSLFFFRLWAWLVGFIVAVGVILGPFVQVLREERNTFQKSIKKIPVILWCAVMFASVGTIGLPFVVKYTAPIICPPGYQEVAPHVQTKVHKEMPGHVQSATMRPVCIGEDGYYVPNQLIFLGAVFSIFVVFAAVLNLIAISTDTLIENNIIDRKIRYILIPLIFIIFLFIVKVDPLITPNLTKSLNKLLYPVKNINTIKF
jgi:hypothetical protein